MNYNNIVKQWKGLIDEGKDFVNELQTIRDNISECLEKKGYGSEQEEQNLMIMRICCYELHRIFSELFD